MAAVPPSGSGSSEEQGPASEQSWAAAERNISLSQAILAPLDAVFKAQLHAARSFLNLLLQLGYPHQPLGPGDIPTGAGDTPYYLEFPHDSVSDGKATRQVIRVPALALVPVAPLAVQEAEFRFALEVRELARYRQIQKSEEASVRQERDSTNEYFRPWFLVQDPVSVRGVLAPPRAPSTPSADEQEAQEHGGTARIEVEIRLAAIPIPSGLSRLLTALTQISEYKVQSPLTPSGL